MNMDSSRILAIINDQTLGLSTPPSAAAKSTRIGARAILFDGNSRVALVYEHRYHHYKLPGGNVEPGENLEQAVRREIKEEVGANIADIRYLGVVHSYLSAYNEDCDQHYFTARVDGEIGESAWIDEEELHGCQIIWCDNLQQAIKRVQSGTSKEYVHLFERTRELAGLKAGGLLNEPKNNKLK